MNINNDLVSLVVESEQQIQQQPSSGFETVIIKQEKVDVEVNITNCCDHHKQSDIVKQECNVLIQTLLKRKLAEITRLEKKNKKLLAIDQNRLREINLLQSKLSAFTGQKISSNYKLRSGSNKNTKISDTAVKCPKQSPAIKTEPVSAETNSFNNETESADRSKKCVDYAINNSNLEQFAKSKILKTEDSTEGKKEYHVKLTLSLRNEVWDSFRVSKLSQRFINRSQMNSQQQSEADRLSEYTNQLIAENFGQKTSFNFFRLTQYGYYVSRRNPSSNWFVKLDINKKTVCISVSNAAKKSSSIKEHATQEIKRILVAKTNSVFKVDVWKSFKYGHLVKHRMNHSQSKEILKFDRKISEILSESGVSGELSATRCYKTNTGYTFKRMCRQRNCETNFKLRVDIENGIGLVHRENECKH